MMLLLFKSYMIYVTEHAKLGILLVQIMDTLLYSTPQTLVENNKVINYTFPSMFHINTSV